MTAVISAGLPNITGSTGSFAVGNYAGSATGAFTVNTSSRDCAESYTKTGVNIRIDASRSSSIYGASNTVQPASITLIPQIKYQYLICGINKNDGGWTVSLDP